MLTKIKELQKKIETTEDFKNFKQKQPESYLSSIFISEEIEYHYYNPTTDKISTFSEEKSSTNLKIFKKPETKVKPLNLDKIKISFEEINKTIEKKLQEKATKKIIILQTLDSNTIYNITIITTKFNIFNLKVNAENREIIHESLRPVFEFKEQSKK